jgi:N-carbamoylputrescine amidase
MNVKLALIQSSDQGSQQENLAAAIIEIESAAQQGAQIVCTQELFLNEYFCKTQDDAHFEKALKINSKEVKLLQDTAAKNKVVLVTSIFEEAMTGLYYNTALIIDADGTLLGKYRKNHIPQDPFFEEKFYFAPGDSGYPVWNTSYGKIGVLICWDQWFPEAARLLALKGAEIILVPTAIGWLPEEKEEVGTQQFTAWLEVQRGHAVANSCYWAAVNRTGLEAPIEFWGQSFVCNYAGEVISKGSIDSNEIVMAECDLKALEKNRQTWPFFRDRRIDSYQDILKRQIDE